MDAKFYWFNVPAVKPLLPLAGASFVKVLSKTFQGNRIFFGSNLFPEGRRALRGPVGWISGHCPKKRALVVTDEFAARFSRKVARAFEDGGFTTRTWDRSLPEAPVSRVQELAAVMKEYEPDLIVAVGGGSVIDGAKAAWILYERPDITDLFQGVLTMAPLNLRKKAILAAVPTTSGTGSEVTHAAVLHDEETHRKVPIANPELVPDFALLNPEFTLTMPPMLTMGCGLDVLAHACDAFFATANNDFSDALALKAVEMTFQWLPVACRYGDDTEARYRMLIASAMAGLAFANSNTALTHSLGHALGGVFHVHHGIAVGLFIPYALQFYHPVTDRHHELAKVLEVRGKSPEQSFRNLTRKLKRLFQEIGAPWSIKELGVAKKDLLSRLEDLARFAVEDPSTINTPRPLGTEEAKQLFRYAYDGKTVDF